MKEFSTSSIIRLDVGKQSVLGNRYVQSVILSSLNGVTKILGYPKASTSELLTVVNGVLRSSAGKAPSISHEELVEFLALISSNYGLQLTLLENGRFVQIGDFDLKHADIDLNVDEKAVQDALVSVFTEHYPQYLLQRLRESELEIKRLKERGLIEFLSTSALHGRKEISDRLISMIENARDHIYFMLAFYEEDVLFFSSFLKDRVLNGNLKLRIIYNPKGERNRQLILQLRKSLGDSDPFFRAYEQKYIRKPVARQFIGNLHSKAVVTESELLVGSANMTSQALYSNIENALYTNDERAVQEANDFFESVWEWLKPPDSI